MSPELIEQCISAYLECIDSNKAQEFTAQMNTILENLEINYSDYRSYDENAVVGNPEDAVIVFNKITADFMRKNEYEK